MIYKSMTLIVMFVLLLGTNRSNAQEPCDCLKQIEDAVTLVMGTTGCDDPLWEAPNALVVHLAKLQNWCSETPEKPYKSKKLNILEGMLETIQDAYAGESIPVLGGDPIVIHVPAPYCALDELAALEGILEDILIKGCPSPIVE